jgi:nucleotide-binding universal stress UspA family protein
MNPALTLSMEPHLNTTRVRFANLLVAVDLSAASASTLKIAADMAYRLGSRLIVAHVIDRRGGSVSETAAEIQSKISTWMSPYLRDGARHAIAIAEGDVIREISSLVKKHSADLLIIGTHAATNVERLVMGSTAEALFRNISIPVLTIGPHVHGPAAGFSSILLPTDLGPGSLRATQYAVSLAEEWNATVTLLHVTSKSEGAGAHEAAIAQMQQLVPEDAAMWCKPVFRTASGDLSEAILSIAGQTGAGVIVLGVTHARLLSDHAHWSVASKIVRFAECPVLTVRDHL